MRYFNLLVDTINKLRDKGLTRYAAELDWILRRNAQELGDLGDLGELGEEDIGMEEEPALAEPEPIEPIVEEVSDERAQQQRILYYQFDRWHKILDRELPKFEYLGEENILALRSALSGVGKTFEQAIEARPAHFDKDAIERWNAELAKLVRKMHQSHKAPLDATKAKVDAFLLYDTTDLLYKRFQRICGEDGTFSKVTQEFANLMRTFANVIKNVNEEIARTDLTEVR